MGEYEVTTINGVKKPTHVLMKERALGRPITKDEVVHHINGDKRDNRLENLEVMTRSEHTAMHKRGQTASPKTLEKMSKAHAGRPNTVERKLTKEQVMEIVQKLLEGATLSDLAEEYEVSSQVIGGIRDGTRYRDVTSAIPDIEFPLQVRRKKPVSRVEHRKLSIPEVQDVRLALLNRESMRAIAKRFGITERSVIDIRDGRTYTDIPWPFETERYPFSRNVPELVSFLLDHPLSEIGDVVEALKQDYHIYPNLQSIYALKMVRRALSGDTELATFLLSMTGYAEEIEREIHEKSLIQQYFFTPEENNAAGSME